MEGITVDNQTHSPITPGQNGKLKSLIHTKRKVPVIADEGVSEEEKTGQKEDVGKEEKKIELTVEGSTVHKEAAEDNNRKKVPVQHTCTQDSGKEEAQPGEAIDAGIEKEEGAHVPTNVGTGRGKEEEPCAAAVDPPASVAATEECENNSGFSGSSTCTPIIVVTTRLRCEIDVFHVGPEFRNDDIAEEECIIQDGVPSEP